ncbi:MAG: response regulator, partial [Oscillospiraceae bacterium]|nr:response regulator [Oscillospiraceae bacterium]
KGLEFVVNIDPKLPSMLVGDDVRLTQVIMNLLTNAVKYTEKGTVTFGVSAADKSDTSVTLAVSVKDTGIGIREEDMEKLFESFARLDVKRNRSIEGTGLGMSIVTKLLALMNSRPMVESTYGEGSVFSFEIVQEIADPRPIGNNFAHRRDSSDIKKKENISFKDADILVTDDNEMNLKVAKNLLRLFGIETDTASSGAETIEKMGRKHYDIVFLDHMMPQMDGIETLAKLKERELIPSDTVVIALTANAVIGAKESYIDAGFSDYLSKPIELDQLEKVLTQYLSVKTSDDEEEKTEQETGIFEFDPAADDEIMEFSPDDGSASAHADTDMIISQLENAGISVNSGLQYCGGDKDFYIEMLTEYAQSADSRMAELNSALAENDISRYQILVHALKSVSKTVGADDVSELARSLEEAAKRSDPDFIRQNNPELEKMYSGKAADVKKSITPQ